MAKRGKFAGLSAEINKANGDPPTPDSKGRKPGKRSHLNWSQHTVMLDKDVHHAARRLLLDQNDGTDMSDLLNRLLADWVDQHQTRA